MTIQPTAVYAPGTSPASQNFYQTYNTRTLGGGGYTPPSGGGTYIPGQGGSGFLYNQFQRLPGGGQRVTVPTGVPKFLGNRQIIFFAWIATMMMVGLDEWHTHHVLPRPARLWYTSITYGILALVSTIDALAPITNLLAIGFLIAVGKNYYTGGSSPDSEFGSFGAQEAAGQSTTPAPGQGSPPAASGGGKVLAQ